MDTTPGSKQPPDSPEVPGYHAMFMGDGLPMNSIVYCLVDGSSLQSRDVSGCRISTGGGRTSDKLLDKDWLACHPEAIRAVGPQLGVVYTIWLDVCEEAGLFCA